MYYLKEAEDVCLRLIKRASRDGVGTADKETMLEAVDIIVKLRGEIRRLDRKANGPDYDEKGVWQG